MLPSSGSSGYVGIRQQVTGVVYRRAPESEPVILFVSGSTRVLVHVRRRLGGMATPKLEFRCSLDYCGRLSMDADAIAI